MFDFEEEVKKEIYMKRVRLLAIPLLVVLMGIAVFLPLSAGAQSVQSVSNSNGTLTAPVTGTIPGGGTFTGNFVPSHFVGHSGALSVHGTLTGTLTNAAGTVIGTVTKTVNLAVSSAAPAATTCTILNLNTGAIHLNLLGLVVDISPITITITANPSGGLLGQLLCDVANLLSGGSPLGSLANLLNQILTQLGL
jgi:hypothetical protein